MKNIEIVNAVFKHLDRRVTASDDDVVRLRKMERHMALVEAQELLRAYFSGKLDEEFIRGILAANEE